MKHIYNRKVGVLVCFVLMTSTLPGRTAQIAAVPPAASDQSTPTIGWPRQINADGNTITIYQPQLDAWQGNRLTGRAAVSVQTPASPAPTYGVLWFSARTEVNKEADEVLLEDIQITRSSLPQAPAGSPDYLQLIRQSIPTMAHTLSLERIEAALMVTQAEQQQRQQPLQNNPPHIFFSTTPAVLVLVDGQSALRPLAGTTLLRVINTRALLLLDQGIGRYYLYLRDRWVEARSLQGPWAAATNPPAALETAKQAAEAEQLVDLLDDPNPEAKEALDHDIVPTIYVSTTPAELIQTDGPPDFEPIAGTQLLWAKNTSGSLFMNVADQNYYVLISGRWYRTKTLTADAWSYVPGPDLPQDFARIPETHPAGDALPSVPGTPQAQQARIANHIPQTATLRRDTAHLTVTYDGDPQFQPVEGTSLQYAINTPTPVILVQPGEYYACENGVWFASDSPTGPWVVADSVPQVIYTIPVTCPINYVTNAFVYGSTPEVVYVGYMPGYLGTYVEPYGCVVYGSGYAYPGWVGGVWIGAPITFGLGAVFDWTTDYGWAFGFGFGWGPAWRPWWGPWWGHWRDRWWKEQGPWRWRDMNINHLDLYNRWDRQVIVSHRPLGNGGINAGNRQREGDLFAGRDGNIYRMRNGGWEVHDGNRWRSVPAQAANNQGLQTPRNGAGQNGRPGGPLESPAYLDRERNARTLGNTRVNRQPANPGTGNTRPNPPPINRGGPVGGQGNPGGFGGFGRRSGFSGGGGGGRTGHR
jgi:hypothetical protein